jgi:GMP synthase-like glutamine amidotransferase
MRVLHVVNQPGSPAAQFVPPLEERGFEVETVHPLLDEPLPPSLEGYAAIVAGGGVMDTHETDRHPWLAHEVDLFADALARGVPALGLCLGAQLLTLAGGGGVAACEEPEVGWREVGLTDAAADDPLFSAVPRRFRAMEWHYYCCRLPARAVELANNGLPQAFRLGDAAWGTQFHIEVDRGILTHWADAAPDKLVEHGWPRAQWDADVDRFLPAHERIGRTLGERFADLTRRRAGAERAA